MEDLPGARNVAPSVVFKDRTRSRLRDVDGDRERGCPWVWWVGIRRKSDEFAHQAGTLGRFGPTWCAWFRFLMRVATYALASRKDGAQLSARVAQLPSSIHDLRNVRKTTLVVASIQQRFTTLSLGQVQVSRCNAARTCPAPVRPRVFSTIGSTRPIATPLTCVAASFCWRCCPNVGRARPNSWATSTGTGRPTFTNMGRIRPNTASLLCDLAASRQPASAPASHNFGHRAQAMGREPCVSGGPHELVCGMRLDRPTLARRSSAGAYNF